MKIKVSTIVSRVFALLDENEQLVEERVELGDAGMPLKPLIIDLLPDAARVVLCQAPLSKIDDCLHTSALPVGRTGSGMCVATLPDDFLRLVNVRMSDWPAGVSTPLAFGGEQHQLRRAALSRVGHASAPAVAVRCRGMIRELEIFGTASGSVIEEFDYLAEPGVTDQYIDLPLLLLGDVCAKLTEMVEAVIND